MKRTQHFVLLILILLLSEISFGQKGLVFDGQLSGFTNYSPEADKDLLLGLRYIPELNYNLQLTKTKALSFQAAANIFGNLAFGPAQPASTDGELQPYRFWVRYTAQQLELRVGLQKIDFGSATLLRPLQWFNQIDPRDPLKLTHGVYAALGRYYFLNNANIWLWVLYGNQKTRGYEFFETNKNNPEFGGRFQMPVPKGELAFSYHHRTADAKSLVPMGGFDNTPEDRFSIDGKWDVKVGLWFEAAHVRKAKNLGILTHQSFVNLGLDYTFGLGNGLNVLGEHLLMTNDKQAFGFKSTTHLTAATLSYPLTLFSNVSVVLYRSWATDDFSFFLNYEHQFKKTTGYIMLYYNPKTLQGIQENELVNTFSGPGIRLMLVFNH